MSDVVNVEGFEVLKLQEGDRLLIRIPDHLDMDLDRIADDIHKRWGIKVLVVSAEIEVAVVREDSR